LIDRFFRLSIAMPSDPNLSSLRSRLHQGVEVAVAGAASDKLLGVREGFLRYFHDGLDRPVPVVVVPHPEAEAGHGGLVYSDEETLALARQRAHRLRSSLGEAYHFYAGVEGGLHSIEIDSQTHYFVRSWAVLLGVAGEAWGSSGSIEIPGRLIEGLEGRQVPLSIPGTRRSGGMISSLTGRLETRRSAAAQATLHALSTLFYGILESRPVRRRR